MSFPEMLFIAAMAGLCLAAIVWGLLQVGWRPLKRKKKGTEKRPN